jgi:tRNA-Thr(GGU) m(6)t(6)A37 methyltransferase TsaA
VSDGGGATPPPPWRVIGRVRAPALGKGDLPRQPGLGRGPAGVIELAAEIPLEALDDLSGFERIWVITWLDRATGWRPRVLPPRGERKRGVFATRSPHRPNPVGLSCVRVTGIEGRCITIEDHDLLDGTPVLDLKPYLPWVDAHPDSTTGWVEGPPSALPLEVGAEAARRLDWLGARGVPLGERIRSTLAEQPEPRRGRRIAAGDAGLLVWSWRTWRVEYRLEAEDALVRVVGVRSGLDPDRDDAVDDPRDSLALHRAFRAAFPRSGLPGGRPQEDAEA